MRSLATEFIRRMRVLLLQLTLKSFVSRYLLSRQNILVIAPHPDDETFGCAGLIDKKVALGASVHVVFLTGGEKSLAGVAEDEIVRNRQQSALCAMRTLGVPVQNLHWLGWPDGGVPRRGEKAFDTMVRQLVDIAVTAGAKEIYTPGDGEGWPDHLAAAELGREAVGKLPETTALYFYWVWTWYYLGLHQIPTLPWRRLHLLPVQDVRESKRRAMTCYLENKTSDGRAYTGKLPPVFLEAFDWNFELFERIGNDEI